jgi:aspartate/methionine/tyrosine aminotransferase
MTLLARRLAHLGTENAFRVGDDIARATSSLAARGLDVIRLNLGEPDFDSAAHINDVACAEIRSGNTHYTDPQGIRPLRVAVAEHVRCTRGLSVDPAQVVITTGGKPSIGFTMQAYVNPGDQVIYPSPGFPIYESWVTYMGGVPVPLPLREEAGFTFTADDLDARITSRTKVIILCSPSNPTGGVLSQGELADIAYVIRTRCKPTVRVYSDEIYEHIVFDGAVHHSIAAEDGMAGRTIIASGHSKGFAMTGWRLGWVVLPTVAEALVFKTLTINVVSCVPPFIQEAGRVALTSPESAAAITHMVSAFEERRDWVVTALNGIPGIRCQLPKGAFYVFPNVEGICERLGLLDAVAGMGVAGRTTMSPSRLLQSFLLERYGVATVDRNSFGQIGAEGQHFLRLSIATSLERLQVGIGRIAQAADGRDEFRRFVTEAAESGPRGRLTRG